MMLKFSRLWRLIVRFLPPISTITFKLSYSCCSNSNKLYFPPATNLILSISLAHIVSLKERLLISLISEPYPMLVLSAISLDLTFFIIKSFLILSLRITFLTNKSGAIVLHFRVKPNLSEKNFCIKVVVIVLTPNCPTFWNINIPFCTVTFSLSFGIIIIK